MLVLGIGWNNGGDSRGYFAGVHGEDDGAAAFSAEFGCHVLVRPRQRLHIIGEI